MVWGNENKPGRSEDENNRKGVEVEMTGSWLLLILVSQLMLKITSCGLGRPALES